MKSMMLILSMQQYVSKNLSSITKSTSARERNDGGDCYTRDISTSMMGVYSEWSSSVVKAVVELARTKE